jgi:hypothetical protein
MMLKSLAFVVSLVATQVLADPVDDLLVSVDAGDTAGVERQVRAADGLQGQTLLLWWLASSHPDMRAFVRSWAEREPDNPIALIGYGWSLHREGYRLRGKNTVAHSWPASLNAAEERFDAAFELAEAAVRAEPDFDAGVWALLAFGRPSGNAAEAMAEAERVLATRPNGLILREALALQSPAWGGSLAGAEDLCERYAGQLSGDEALTVEGCLVLAGFSGGQPDETLEWARGQLGDYLDHPLFATIFADLAHDQRLPDALIEPYREARIADGTLTLDAALLGTDSPLTLPELPQPDIITPAFTRDLAYGLRFADRDPANPEAVEQLAALYDVADLLGMQSYGAFSPTPPADAESMAAKHREEMAGLRDDLSRRALAALEETPQNPSALMLAAELVRKRYQDRLETARWRLSLAGNALVYTDHLYTELRNYIRINRNISPWFEVDLKAGRSDYTQAELDDVFTCPLIRAVRLLDEACEKEGLPIEQCYVQSSTTISALHAGPDSPFDSAEFRGACLAEREGPLQSLRFTEVDPDL